ncbi:hypothetical protein [Nocardia sp. NPDC050406]|uniref:hypothetical protein n=1 Tax=Nocardia sp. NPDC050406 TaxID=3364318 RepID=UPI003795643D
MRIRAAVVAALAAGTVLITPVAAQAVPAPARDVSTSSAECAMGLLAGLIAALTTGSSAAVGCPTSA